MAIEIPKDPIYSWGVSPKEYTWMKLEGTNNVAIFILEWDDMDGTRKFIGMDLHVSSSAGSYYHQGSWAIDLDYFSGDVVHQLMTDVGVPVYHGLRGLTGTIAEEVKKICEEYMDLYNNKIEVERIILLHSR